MSHTPTPWAVCTVAVNDQWYPGVTIGAADPGDARRIADVAVLNSDHLANAAFIVQAVNSHEALVEALNKAEIALSYCAMPPGTLHPQNQAQFLVAQNAVDVVKAALARVEGA